MKTEELSQKVLETIKDKHLKPKPKWEFMLKNYIIWILSITSLVVGSFAFAVIIYMVRNSNWDLYQNLSGNLLGLILASLPYFWFIFLIIFILISYYNFRHTKSGYRYKFYLIVV
jgi:heme/copper-type cytochrome/quinol oxidase subunit 2